MNINKDNQENIVIIGSGAQAKYIVDIVSYYSHIDIIAMVMIEKNIDSHFEQDLQNIKIIQDIKNLKKLSLENYFKAIVAVPDNGQKESLLKQLEKLNIDLANVVHPKAVIARTVKIGKNVLINAGAVIQPYVCIGKGVMVHANVVIEHNCKIGDYVNLGPGVKLAGWVRIKNGAYIYTGASIKPGITIGERSIVGAGAVVIRNVPDNVTVAGNPAKIIKKEDGKD